MNDSKRVWVWVGVVVVAAAIAVVFVWNPGSKPAAPSAPAPVYAPQGQLVPQFPKDLILDSNAAISGSYSIDYASSSNQYTAEYNSSSSMKSLFGDYQTYLPQNGWTVIGSDATHPMFSEISANQGTNQLQVVISQVGKGSQVTISYGAH
jgi:hypothetical protein